MSPRVKVVSSGTVFSNTPETDLLPTVLHRVCVEIDARPLEVTLLAADPLDAMDRIHAMSVEDVLALPRMKEPQ